jgi:hypothetical protein
MGQTGAGPSDPRKNPRRGRVNGPMITGHFWDTKRPPRTPNNASNPVSHQSESPAQRGGLQLTTSTAPDSAGSGFDPLGAHRRSHRANRALRGRSAGRAGAASLWLRGCRDADFRARSAGSRAVGLIGRQSERLRSPDLDNDRSGAARVERQADLVPDGWTVYTLARQELLWP